MIKSNSTMAFQVYLQIDESEARALKEITIYGHKHFLEMFYGKLGTGLKEHEKGLISLFETINKELPSHLKRIDDTRKLFQDQNPNINK